MVFGCNLISVLNTDTAKADTLPIDEFYRHHIEREEVGDSDYFSDIASVCTYIDFTNNNMMIREKAGYTKLLRIYILNSKNVNRKTVMIGEDSVYSVCTDGSQVIELFNPNKSTTGFHGEVKYKSIVKNVAQIEVDEIYLSEDKCCQIFSLTDSQSPLSVFKPVKHIDSQPTGDDLYMILTSTKRYNCNEVLLCDDSNWVQHSEQIFGDIL